MDSGQHNDSQIARMIWIVGSPIIFSTGIICNIITIIVLTLKNRNKSSTTVYLNVLAAADMLVMIISLPRWWIIYMFGIDVRHLSNGMCKIHWFLTYFDSAVSINILVALTIERIICTIRPHKVKKLCTVRSALTVSVAIILTMAVLYAHVLYGLELFYKEVPGHTSSVNNNTQLLMGHINLNANQTQPTLDQGVFNNNKSTCRVSTTTDANCSSLTQNNITFPISDEVASYTSTRFIRMCWFGEQNYGKFYSGAFQIMNILFYTTIPEMVFLIGGVIIVRMLTVNRKRVAPEIPRRTRNQPQTNMPDIHSKQITVSLLLVNLVFFICTTPIFIFLLGRSVWIDEETGMTETQEIIWAICNMMFYTNHAVNFVLYFLKGARFRKQVLQMFCCRKNSGDNSTATSRNQAQRSITSRI